VYSGLKVLIIEDRRENIVFLANNILKPKGFDVITAMDGKAGLRKALEETPDIIITDLKLPKMHGLDILADLQDRGSTIPAIVMTFHGSEETAIKAFRLGAKDYLIKPFQVEDVEIALERAVASLNRHASGKAEKVLQQQVGEMQEKIAELEAIIDTPTKAAPPQKDAQPTDVLDNLSQQLAKQQQNTEKWKQEAAKCNELLTHQTTLTTEARNSAKAMVQFIRLQQKEIVQQKYEVENLAKQVESLSQHLTRLMTRLDAQARQFHIPPPRA
jgi:DNA-binding response OmpR family regulator